MMGWQELGLGPGETEVYQALLAHPGVDFSSLARLVRLSREEVRDATTRLHSTGLIRLEAGAAYPLPPDQGIEALIQRAQDDIARRQSAIAEARQVLPSLVDAYLEGHASVVAQAPYEELTEPAAVRSRIFRLAATACESAWSMIPGGAFTPEATAASRRTDEDLLGRGVTVECIVSLESCLKPYWRDYLDDISAAGAQVRVHPAPPLLAVLFDESIALLPRSGHRGAIVLHGADIAAPVVQLFRHLWGDSTPYVEFAGPSEELSPWHQQVLILLSEGHTDEVIARRMGVSSRTVRRLVAEVCATLQAHSRFQAGAEATRRGLLPRRPAIEGVAPA